MGKSSGYNSHYYANQSPQTMEKVIKGGDFSSGISNFGKAIINRQVEAGKAYYGTPGMSTLQSFMPNFSDSMSALDKDSDDFNQDLYNVLSDEEKAQLEDDKGFKAWDLGYAIPFIGLFQDTREAYDEMVGTRHPEILESAKKKYNEKLKRDEAQKIADNLKRQMDYQQKQLQEAMRDEFNAKLKVVGAYNIDHLPVRNNPVNTENIPIDVTRGRGLSEFQRHPAKHVFDNHFKHKITWEGTSFSVKNKPSIVKW